jgi:endogenous inhibitor of DNA gyrase (YacG/DUF329 family)
MHKVKCPTCETAVEWKTESKWRPFCSERCKLIDLGDWIEEKNRISDNEPAQSFMPSDSTDSIDRI